MKKLSFKLFIIPVLIYFYLTDGTLLAKKNKKFDIIIGIESEYNSNIFKFTKSQLDKYNENSSKDKTTERFKDVESISDTIFSPIIGIKYKFSKKIDFKTEFQYNIFKNNSEKNYFEGEFEISTKIGKKGKLELKGEYINQFFRKNYLSGTNNSGSTDNISRDERVYSSAFYDRYETVLNYSYKLLSSKKKDLKIDLLVGNITRDYNETFDNRDRLIWEFGGGVEFSFLKKMVLTLSYIYQKQFSPAEDELILLDETIFNKDITGDGSIGDDAEFITKVDRSRYNHILDFNVQLYLMKNFSIFFKTKIRKLIYFTDNSLDYERYQKGELRKYLTLGISGKIDIVNLKLEYERVEDEGVEDNFTVNKGSLKVEIEF